MDMPIALRGPLMAQRTWYGSRLCWTLIAVGSALPFLFARFPMMPDYFSHTARYHIMNFGEQSPFLARYYSFRWVLIGNMGVDLAMVPLGRLFGTELGTRLAAASIPPLTIWAIHALSTALHGRVAGAAFWALPLVWSFNFAFGFVNYCLSLALAFLAAAAWIRLSDASAWRRGVLFVPVGMLVWICHVAGWGILCIIVGSLELVRATRAGRFDVRAFFTAVGRSLPVALPLLFIAYGLLFSPLPEGPAGDASRRAITIHGLLRKVPDILSVVRNESKPLDKGTAYAIVAVCVWLFLRRLGLAHRGLLLGALLVIACYFAFPPMILGSWFADERMLAPGMMLFLISIGRLPPAGDRALALTGLALFSARIAVESVAWHARSESLARDLALVDSLPRGATIAVASPNSGCGTWSLDAFDHAASLAIIRREAYVNTEWNFAGYFLMHPIWTAGIDPARTDPLVDGTTRHCSRTRTVGQFLDALPRRYFGYVWLFDNTAPASARWLRLIGQGPNSKLYRILAPDAGSR